MREWDFDVVILQRIPDREQHLRCELVLAVINPVYLELDREIDTAVSKATQLAIRAIWIVQNKIQLCDSSFDDLGYLVYVRVIAD